MNGAELWCRLAQAGRRCAERFRPASALRHVSDADLRSAVSLDGFPDLPHREAARVFFDHLRTRETPGFFAGVGMSPDELDRWAVSAAARTACLGRAQRIIDGEFDLLAYDGLRFDDPSGGLRWNYDPVSDVEAPRIFWGDVDYLDPAVAGDSKVIWELNRFQFVFDLGKAYAFTGDERYAEAYFALFDDWHRKNPPGIGVNWCSSLELGLRGISWIWGHYFFRESRCCTAEAVWQLLRSLVIHARRIAAYLSYYFSPNTHLLGEALGLFYIGLFLPEFEEAENWKRLGIQILLDEAHKQIRPDGGYFEQSTYYHRYALDFYQHFMILCDLNGIELPAGFRTRIEKATEFALYAMLPNGHLPMIGDADGGKALQLERCDPNDARPTLATGAVLFGRGDFKRAAGGLREESLYLLGAEGAEAFAAIEETTPRLTSVHYPDTGWFFLRSGWEADANYLHFDCGPQGMRQSGHGHADMLGIEVAARGRPLIVDPGTYTYTVSPGWRDYFRGTASHNTATVDGLDQAVRAGPFKWERLPAYELVTAHLGERLDYIDARHNGYERLDDPVVHRRRVLFVKPEYWVIVDTFEAAGDHDYEIAFSLAPAEAAVQPETLAAGTRDPEQPNCTIVPACAHGLDADVKAGSEDPIRGWVSYNYGARVPSPAVRYRLRGGRRQVAFVIYPQAAGETVPVTARLLEVDAEQGGGPGGAQIAMEVGIGGALHYVAMSGRADGSLSFNGFRMKAEAAWIRADAAGGPSELRLVNGSEVSWRGRELFCSRSVRGEVSEEVGGRPS